MKNKIKNCAIVGFGKMGLMYYSIIKKLRLNIVSVCDLNSKNKRNLSKQDQKKFTNNFNKVLNKKIDFLIISSTADYHALYAKKAIKKNVRNILIEKPVATSLKDCAQLIKLQKKYRTRICVNHNEYFRDHTLKLKRFIKSKRNLGKIVSIIYSGGNMGFAMNAIHIFDLIHILSNGKITKVLNFFDKENTKNPRGKKFSDKSGRLIGETNNGVNFFINISNRQGHGRNIKILFEYGIIDIDFLTGKVYFNIRRKKFQDLPKTRYSAPFTKGFFNLKIKGIYFPTLKHIKNFLSNKNYRNLKNGVENVKILVASNLNKKIDLTNVENIKSKHKFPWA